MLNEMVIVADEDRRRIGPIVKTRLKLLVFHQGVVQRNIHYVLDGVDSRVDASCCNSEALRNRPKTQHRLSTFIQQGARLVGNPPNVDGPRPLYGFDVIPVRHCSP